MGGKMEAHSARGKGSMFSCTISFALQTTANQMAKTEVDKTPSKTVAKNTTQKNASTIQILLVEDDKLIQKVHKKMLEQAGCAVAIAENGPQTLAMYDQGYDAIFLDVGLPRMSGLEVATEIRKRESNGTHIPIIALTGFVHEEDKINCLAAGIDAVATKPIMPNELQLLLQQWVIAKK
jgi:CheY-like chemotaxis protein